MARLVSFQHREGRQHFMTFLMISPCRICPRRLKSKIRVSSIPKSSSRIPFPHCSPLRMLSNLPQMFQLLLTKLLLFPINRPFSSNLQLFLPGINFLYCILDKSNGFINSPRKGVIGIVRCVEQFFMGCRVYLVLYVLGY